MAAPTPTVPGQEWPDLVGQTGMEEVVDTMQDVTLFVGKTDMEEVVDAICWKKNDNWVHMYL